MPPVGTVAPAFGDKAPDLLSNPRAGDTKCLFEGVYLETYGLSCVCVCLVNVGFRAFFHFFLVYLKGK